MFNDLAVCTLHALENLGVKRVAVVDLDVHQGDGTATILADEPRACTISVHCSTNFPFRKSISDHDLPVAPESGDEVYLNTVREALDICEAFEPDLILYQAGVDGLEADALGKLKVSRKVCGSATISSSRPQRHSAFRWSCSWAVATPSRSMHRSMPSTTCSRMLLNGTPETVNKGPPNVNRLQFIHKPYGN